MGKPILSFLLFYIFEVFYNTAAGISSGISLMSCPFSSSFLLSKESPPERSEPRTCLVAGRQPITTPLRRNLS